MGRQEGAAYIGAVALGSLIFNFVYWSFGFLRMGTTGLAAQAYGQQRPTQMIVILGRALLFAVGSGLLLLALQVPIAKLSFALLGASTEVETLARQYFYVRIWAAPATLSLYVLMGWYFGMQNSVYPLLLTLFVNGVNIVANLYFVQHLGMTANGVAMGTVVAQYSGLALGLALFMYRYRGLLANLERRLLWEWQAFRAFMQLNRDIFIRTFCLVFAFAFFDNQSAQLGDLTLAANGVLLQFTFWMSYGVDGFGYAAESLVGRYQGATDRTQLRSAVRHAFGWGMGLAVVYSLGYGIWGEALLWIFTDQAFIVAAAVPYLPWLVVFPLAGTPAYIWDGIYVGMTASIAMRNTMAMALGVFLAFYYAQHYATDWGNHGLWAALTLMMATRGVVQWWWYAHRLQRGKA